MRNELKDIFNRIQFTGLEGVLCGDALHHVEYRAKRGRLIKCCLDTALATFFSKISINPKEKSEIVFLFSNSYKERSDKWAWFSEVYHLVNSRIVVKPYKNRFTRKHLKYIRNYFLWCKKIKQIKGYNIIEKLYYITELYKAAVDVWEIKEWIIKNNLAPKLLVVVYDGHLIDSLAVQLFNTMNIDTASLQHGNYSATKYNWGFIGSQSKYILVYGQYTKNAGLKCGISEERLITVGMPQYINKKLPTEFRLNDQKGKFGIILNGGEMIHENRKMLKLAEELAEKRGVKYNIKFHPTIRKENNPILNGLKYVDEIYQNEISIIQFAKTIDYAIINESTVFYDYILNLIPVFIYEMDWEMFEDIFWCKIRNVEELNYMVTRLFNDTEEISQNYMKTRKYLCESGVIAENYRSFFRRYIE